MTYDIRETQCPECGYKIELAVTVTEVELRAPKPGDVSVCFNCGQLSVWDKERRLRRPSLEETEIFIRDQRIVSAIL
jgi:hypothetical protein